MAPDGTNGSGRALRFGIYRLYPGAGELYRRDVRVKLQELPMLLLSILVERRDQVVTREELAALLWPDTVVDFDLALNTAIRKIRAVLDDSAEHPRYLETVPKRGYRFIASVEEVRPQAPAAAARELPAEPAGAAGRAREMRWGAAILAALSAGLVAGGWLGRPAPIPRIVRYTQLTNDGAMKGGMVLTDGLRVYFGEFSPEGAAVLSVPVAGEPAGSRTRPWTGFWPSHLSPDGTALLATAEVKGTTDFNAAIWVLPLPDGTPRSLGMKGRSPVWSPDGERIAYLDENDVRIARKDGSGQRTVATLKEFADTLRWSPDGSQIRVHMSAPDGSSHSVWQMTSTGAGMHQLLPPGSSLGTWFHDRRYFVFSRVTGSSSDLWWADERDRRGPGGTVETHRLTFGPLDLSAPVASPNGKTLFAVGRLARGQLARYDPASRQFLPYLGGISAGEVAFSRDGQWVAYTSWPGQTLWRSRVDGSQRLQLTGAAEYAHGPRWSPDGRTIAVAMSQASSAGMQWKIHLVPADGGPASELAGDAGQATPAWSEDGRFLAFGGAPWTKRFDPDSTAISIFAFATRGVSTVAGSRGFWAPKWSPDGRFIVAQTTDMRKLMLLDRKDGSWTTLAELAGMAGYVCWSHDSSQVYYNLIDERAVQRVRLRDRRVEQVLSLKDVPVAFTQAPWFGLGPDDSLLVLRDASIEEIYALDVEFR